MAAVVSRNTISIRERECWAVRLHPGDAFVDGTDTSLSDAYGIDPVAALFCN